ncbi:DNA topoisomerase IB [Salinarimonas ramus]|uniref:DNA topoisomerase n=1 Tax=Salinarimonas ramus TaxID=690164 RepID=A0A917Q6K1_9HYPH|nr:DNA topoisomerase IB [Salinarimonas ramus]GGK30617.1 DNA topoisomerase [Salinarimonas ramus]
MSALHAEPAPQESLAESGVVDPADAAESAGLTYVTDDEPGIRRKRSGKGFTYTDAKGRTIKDKAELARLKSLAVPPAYTDVWISPDPNGHIQATGRDARGRKQYRYHPRFREVRDSTKFEHLVAFAEALPQIRERVDADMRKRTLTREKVLATIVHLLETTLIRVGNADYVRRNKTYGLTTLGDEHVDVEGDNLRFVFSGKGGKEWRLKVRDRRVARTVRLLEDLPGQRLFQWVDEDGTRHAVESADVNTYLREITGREITAKDFRTWGGTVLAAVALREFEAFDTKAAAKKNLKAAIEQVSSRLGNTPTICRKCYVHPEVLSAYLEGSLAEEVTREAERALARELDGLEPEEAAVLAVLRTRLALESRAG